MTPSGLMTVLHSGLKIPTRYRWFLEKSECKNALGIWKLVHEFMAG